MIAKFFKEIGWVEELGSGVRNTFKFAKLYSSGKDPVFEEGDVFKCFIPLAEAVRVLPRNQDSNLAGNQDKQSAKWIVNSKELLDVLRGLTVKEREDKILPLLEDFLLDIEETYTETQLNKVRPYLEYKNEYWLPILEFCYTPRNRREIFQEIGLSNQTKNLKNILLPLVDYGFIQRTIPDRLTSANQKYFTTAKGRKLLHLLKEFEQPNH